MKSYEDNMIQFISVFSHHITVFITVHLLSSTCIWHKSPIWMNCPLWNSYFLFYCASIFLLLANCNNIIKWILFLILSFWQKA